MQSAGHKCKAPMQIEAAMDRKGDQFPTPSLAHVRTHAPNSGWAYCCFCFGLDYCGSRVGNVSLRSTKSDFQHTCQDEVLSCGPGKCLKKTNIVQPIKHNQNQAKQRRVCPFVVAFMRSKKKAPPFSRPAFSVRISPRSDRRSWHHAQTTPHEICGVFALNESKAVYIYIYVNKAKEYQPTSFLGGSGLGVGKPLGLKCIKQTNEHLLKKGTGHT